jgi:hypothetical protein
MLLLTRPRKESLGDSPTQKLMPLVPVEGGRAKGGEG